MNFNFSDPTVMAVIGVVALLIVLAIVWVVMKQRNRRRTEELRARFGPEYDLALREYGSRAKAEASLLDRVNRVNRMTVHPLADDERERYFAEWEAIQARFIDHPRGAVTEADEMINSLLRARGYEGGAFDRRAPPTCRCITQTWSNRIAARTPSLCVPEKTRPRPKNCAAP